MYVATHKPILTIHVDISIEAIIIVFYRHILSSALELEKIANTLQFKHPQGTAKR